MNIVRCVWNGVTKKWNNNIYLRHSPEKPEGNIFWWEQKMKVDCLAFSDNNGKLQMARCEFWYFSNGVNINHSQWFYWCKVYFKYLYSFRAGRLADWSFYLEIETDLSHFKDLWFLTSLYHINKLFNSCYDCENQTSPADHFLEW